MEFEILTKTISAIEDEEVWLYFTPNSPSWLTSSHPPWRLVFGLKRIELLPLRGDIIASNNNKFKDLLNVEKHRVHIEHHVDRTMISDNWSKVVFQNRHLLLLVRVANHFFRCLIRR